MYLFNSVIWPILTFLFLYVTLISYDDITRIPIIGKFYFSHLNVNIIVLFIIILLAVSFLGYTAIYTSKKSLIELYILTLGILTLVVLGYSIYIVVYSFQFHRFFEQNWGDLMIYVDQDSFSKEKMNCYGGKYV